MAVSHRPRRTRDDAASWLRSSPSVQGRETTVAAVATEVLPGSAATVSPIARWAARARGWAPIGAPSGLMLGLALWGLGRPSMYGTEAVTYWAARLPVHALLHVLRHVDAVHGLYYALMHIVFLFGGGTIALRLPSAIAMTGAVALTGVLARQLSGSNRVALFAGLSMTTIPFVDTYAQGGRSYAIDAAAVLITSYLLLRALRPMPGGTDQSRRWWLAYGVALAVTGYLHEMTALVIVSHAVTLWWARTDRTRLRRWLVTVSCAVIALVPLIVVSALQQGQLSWVRPATFGTALSLVATYLGPSRIAMAVNGALIVVGAVANLRRYRSAPAITLVRFALPLLVLPPAVVLAESAITHPLYGGSRYFLYCAPGAALLVGAGIERVIRFVDQGRVRGAAWLVGTAIMVALLALQWPLQQRLRTPQGAPQDMHALSVYVHEHAHHGDGILYVARPFSVGQLAFPSDFGAVRDLVVASSPERSGTLYGTIKGSAGLRRAVLAERRVWLVGVPPKRSAAPTELRALEDGFHATSHHHVIGAWITLYVRNRVTNQNRARSETDIARVRLG